MSRIVIVILIYHRHKPTDIINLLGSWRRGMFPVRYGQTCIVELSLNKNPEGPVTGQLDQGFPWSQSEC
jgi:hypothetical protein